MARDRGRKVVQFQMGGDVWFFGSVKALCDRFGNVVGNYSALEKRLWTLRKKGDEVVVNTELYTIRVGNLIVSAGAKGC